MSVGDPLSLSFIIDPGGIPGVRPGINLRVYPAGDVIGNFESIGTQAERLSNSSLSSGGFKQLFEFSTDFYLTGEDFDRFYAMQIYNQNSRDQGLPWEVVIYNLAKPFSEIASSRSRYKVPGTDVIRSVAFGNGLIHFTYWCALQGALVSSWVQEGELFRVSAQFQEGTMLTSEMEL